MYHAMLRNRYYLPKLKSTIISVDYMQKVRYRQYWSLKYEEVHLLPCPLPPPKHYLISEFVRLAKIINVETGIKGLKEPDTEWLLVAIAALKPDHPIF
jgi:hypothetical protein